MPPLSNGSRLVDNPRWLRARLGGQLAVDTRRSCLLYDGERPVPTCAVPVEDVRAELLRTERTDETPVGLARFFDLELGERRAEGAAFRIEAPREGAPEGLEELAIFPSFATLDAWFEEDEQVFLHPRDPWHRVDALQSSRHVRISHNGELLAESRRPVLLFETGLPVRFYLPPLDVRADCLQPSESVTCCPYKGEATYLSLQMGEQQAADIAWSYRFPTVAMSAIAGHVSFYDERVDVEVDGERRPRPRTIFS